MTIKVFLDLIKQKYTPEFSRNLAKSYQHDPLIWSFLTNDDAGTQFINASPESFEALTPGKMAIWQIEKTTGNQLGDMLNAENALPTDIKRLAARTYEATFNTNLPPADLQTAGLLALTLRERWILKGSWKGIAEELFFKRHQGFELKNFLIWRTPVACLMSLCRDFDSFIEEFSTRTSNDVLRIFTPIIVHAFLVNPLPSENLRKALFDFFLMVPLDFQLEGLKWMHFYKRKTLQTLLARELIKSKINAHFFQKTFSELNDYDSRIESGDPLKINVKATLPADLNRLAAFYYYSGNVKKSHETYLKSIAVTNNFKLKTLFQTLVESKEIYSDEELELKWREIVEELPNSNQARLFYAAFLIKRRNFEQAAVLLEGLPDSTEKSFFEYQIQESRTPHKSAGFDLVKPQNIKKSLSPHGGESFFVHDFVIDINQAMLSDLLTKNHLNTNLVLAENLLETHPNDPSILAITRDLYINAKNYEKAIELTTYLNILEPENEKNTRVLARLLMQTQQWPEAYKTLQDLVKSENAPEIEILTWFAEAAKNTDRIDMAISICQNILKQDPYATRALILLGQGFMKKGDMVKAIQHMEKTVEMIPEESETWLALSNLWKENQQFDRAIEVLSKGVLAIPNSPDLLLALGKAHLEKQAPSDAITYMRKAHQISPERLDIIIQLAKAENQLARNENAWQLLKPYQNSYQQNPQIAKILGHVLLSLHQPEMAKPILLFAAKSDPKDKNVVLEVASIILQENDSKMSQPDVKGLQELRQILCACLEHHPRDPDITLGIADIERILGDSQSAFLKYLQLSENEPFEKTSVKARLKFGLGSSAMALDNLEAGLAALKEAAALEPENLSILHKLTEAYHQSDLSQKGSETAKTALKLAPQDLNNILWYAQLKIRNNAPEEAVKALKEALQIDPDHTELRLWLARTLISTGAGSEAKSNIAKLITEPQTNAKDLHQAAYVCLDFNDLNLAAEALEKAQRRTPETDPILLMDLAVCYSLMGLTQKSLEILNQNQNLTQTYSELSLLKSDLLSSLGRFELALNILNNIDETIFDKGAENRTKPLINKSSPLLYAYDFSKKGYHFRHAQLLRILGNITEAKNAFKKAFIIDPEDVRIKNGYIETLASAMAFDKAQQIAAENPNFVPTHAKYNHDFLDLICLQGEMCLRNGDLEGASNHFEKIANLIPTYPRSLALQSRLAQRYGELDIAHEYLKEAIDSYQLTLEKQDIRNLQDVFRQNMNLLAIADAALDLEDFQTSIQFHQKAFDRISNQPLQNLQYGIALMISAEKQRIAQTLLIKLHAPGDEMLSNENFVQFQKQLDLVADFLSDAQRMCYKARGFSAFQGKWGSYLNVEDVIKTPDDAAALIMNSENEEIITSLLNTYSKNPLVLQAYGIHALRFSKRDAVPYVEKALQLEMINPINYALLAFLRMDDPVSALRSLETAINFWPDEPEWHALAAELQLKIGKASSAAKHISLALESNPDNATFWLKSAQINLSKKNLENARDDLERSTSINPDDPKLWLNLAEVNQKLANMPAALSNIKKAQELDPFNFNLSLKSAELLFKTHQYSKALEAAKEVLELDPNNREAKLITANAQAKLGRFEEASQTLEAAISEDPENIDLKLEQIKIREIQEGSEAILPALAALAKSAPRNIDILIYLTEQLIQTNRLEQAEKTAQATLSVNPEQPKVLLLLGRLQYKKGQLDQAISHFSQAISQDPHLVAAYIELGKTYQKRRELEEAIKVFQQAAQANPNNSEPYYYAAMALKESKDFKGAEEMLKIAKKYAPDDPKIKRQLGVITALNLINNMRDTE